MRTLKEDLFLKREVISFVGLLLREKLFIVKVFTLGWQDVD